jgi:SAM-dependent methyltransferase
MAGAKDRERAMWGSAPWERVAPTMGAIHDRLIAALAPRPGQHWLDVGTGTGAVAMRAAHEGARVIGLDLAPPLIETAKRLAAEQALAISFEVGDAEVLPYPDASFDVVSSAHGVVFAPDHAAVARELARVCRPGGRLGMTAWSTGEASDAFHEMIARFAPPLPPGPRPGAWGDQAHARELLGDAFELEFIPEVWLETGESGEAIWQLLTTASPPFKALAERLDRPRRAELHATWVEFYERHRIADGVCVARVRGHRRATESGRRRDWRRRQDWVSVNAGGSERGRVVGPHRDPRLIGIGSSPRSRARSSARASPRRRTGASPSTSIRWVHDARTGDLISDSAFTTAYRLADGPVVRRDVLDRRSSSKGPERPLFAFVPRGSLTGSAVWSSEIEARSWRRSPSARCERAGFLADRSRAGYGPRARPPPAPLRTPTV